MKKIFGIVFCIFVISFSVFSQKENYNIADSLVENAFKNAKEVNLQLSQVDNQNDWQYIKSLLMIDKSRLDIVYAGWVKKLACCSSLACCTALIHFIPSTNPVEIYLDRIENNIKNNSIDDRFFIER